MDIKKAIVWQTSDGQTFPTEKAALFHQSKLDFLTWYCNNPLCHNPSDYDVFDWLRENAEQIKKVIE